MPSYQNPLLRGISDNTLWVLKWYVVGCKLKFTSDLKIVGSATIIIKANSDTTYVNKKCYVVSLSLRIPIVWLSRVSFMQF